jgi:hypothetical protein
LQILLFLFPNLSFDIQCLCLTLSFHKFAWTYVIARRMSQDMLGLYLLFTRPSGEEIHALSFSVKVSGYPSMGSGVGSSIELPIHNLTKNSFLWPLENTRFGDCVFAQLYSTLDCTLQPLLTDPRRGHLHYDVVCCSNPRRGLLLYSSFDVASCSTPRLSYLPDAVSLHLGFA